MSKIVSRGDPLEPIYLNNLKVAAQGWGVLSGLSVTQRGAGANMSVDVSAGSARINGTDVEKGSTSNVVISVAHATYDRYDLIVIDSSGTISVITGTAASVSYANDYDLDSNNAILLAEIYIPANDTSIADSQISDKSITSPATSVPPSGIIMMWHGLIADIPAGYVLCDGTNSTPDLRAKFIRGAPASTEAGSTGGSDTHSLTVDEMPSHSHSLTVHYDSTNTGGYNEGSANGSVSGSVTTSSVGSGDAHNNMPAYYEIIFIMKV